MFMTAKNWEACWMRRSLKHPKVLKKTCAWTPGMWEKRRRQRHEDTFHIFALAGKRCWKWNGIRIINPADGLWNVYIHG
jgi:hypothetical protein